jgi:phytoene synthase
MAAQAVNHEVGHATLAASRDYCRAVTRHAARNFYYGLKLLPPVKRAAMYALYAYMRLVDDIADVEGGDGEGGEERDGWTSEDRVAELEQWRAQTRAILAGRAPAEGSHPVWPAFYEAVHRFGVPAKVFDAIIAGQEQDLAGPVSFGTFEELEQYCYRVAGVVGLASIHVFGFVGGEQTEQLALHRGTAFQLTNILRDLREDALRGRVYLPRAELERFGVAEEQLRSAVAIAGVEFDSLMRFQLERARGFYERSNELVHRVQRDSRPTLIAMTQIYRGLLEKIAADPRRVLRQRVALSPWSKLRIGWRAVRVH